MKTSEVLRILRVTRPTLTKYVKEGLIGVTVKPNGRYEYKDEDVYAFTNKGIERMICAYTADDGIYGTREEMAKKIEAIKSFCIQQGYTIGRFFIDTKRIKFEDKTKLLELIDLIVSGKVSKVITENNMMLSRESFGLFKYIAKKHNCEIISIW